MLSAPSVSDEQMLIAPVRPRGVEVGRAAEVVAVVPKVSSERREYVPIGWLEPPTIPSDLVFVLQDAALWHFGILTSRMHMAWMRHIGGRLESRYRYSVGVVYNPFPWPAATDHSKSRFASWRRTCSMRVGFFPMQRLPISMMRT